MWNELDKMEAKHYRTFTYHDGIRDGELSIYCNDGVFTAQENCIFLLLELRVDIRRIRHLFDLPEKSILHTHAKVKAHISNMQQIKSKRAFARLQKAMDES